MSVQSEIDRIITAVGNAYSKVSEKGGTVPASQTVANLATAIDSIPSSGAKETWVIKNDASGVFATTQISFTSNGQKFTSIGAAYDAGSFVILRYDNGEVAGYDTAGGDVVYEFYNDAYRKLTFDTPPTGDLLTWLQSNGIRQPDDTAVQDTKALTITSNGTVSVTPDAPYDGLNSVDVTVDVASGGSSGEPLDPVEVYNNTRPSDWLSMPTPADNEMYLLFHIPDGFSSLLAFTVTCTGNYTVALGSVSDGAFVQMSSTTVASGSKYETELFADDYGNLTSDGMKQVMVKVSGTDILTWAPSTHSKKTSPSNFAGWNIVEISCNLPSGTSVACGSSTENTSLKKLRYFAWYGKNAVTDMNSMFGSCYSLTAIPQMDTSAVTNMNYMFNACYSLTAIPQMDTSAVTNMNYMFNNCYSLTAIPQIDTSAVTNMKRIFNNCRSLTAIPQIDTSAVTDMNGMFGNCYSLTAIPQIDTSAVTSMNNMFYNCYSLTAIHQMDTSAVTDMYNMFSYCYSLTAVPQMDTSAVTNMNYMFNACYSLTSIALDNTVTGWAGYAISLSDCSLGHAAIVSFFNSLPTITSAKAITLTGNPGVSELTDAEKAIATGKGWTLTL